MVVISQLELDTKTTLADCKGMKRGPRPVPEKERIVELLRQGQFSTLVEASQIAGVSRQRVLQWAEAAGINWKSCRERYLEQLWQRALRRVRMIAKGKAPRKVTKATMRRAAEKAVADFRKPD